MKRPCLLLLFLCIFTAVQSQVNLQVHYDFGHNLYSEFETGTNKRPLLTTTLEMFKPDDWGSTFFFVDMDYTNDGVTSAYLEIFRELQFWNGPLSAHVEYNGGLTNAAPLSNNFLFGPTYTWNNANFTKGFTFSTMYKYIAHSEFYKEDRNNFQLTATWYINFAEGKYSFTGFVDWWKEKNAFGEYIFMTEPQFWVNLNAFNNVNDKFNLSLGTEVEITNNFGGRDGFYAIPTLGIKWTF